MNPTSTLNVFRPFSRRLSALGACAFIFSLALSPVTLTAQSAAKILTGKFYVAGVQNGAQLAVGERVETLTAKSSFPAQGARIETKPAGTVALVLSNGTGLALSQDTHIEVKRFSQEPFVASRTDLESEPSVSQTEISLARGTLSVSTSKLAAGSSMSFLTPLGSISLHGGNLVIEVDGDTVKISLLEGEGTVRGGEYDLGGHVLRTGEQAVIRPGPPGRANLVEITKIPAGELAALAAKAAIAYAARKTVAFAATAEGEIQALPVVTASLPVQATVSPSRLP